MLFLRLLAAALAVAGVRGVGIILVDDQGRFLLNLRGHRSSKPNVTQRPARTLLSQRWAILGGYIEPGETSEEAARREVQEETGLAVRRLHPVVRISWPRPVYLYAASVSTATEEIRLGEGDEHRFVTLDEVPTLSPRAPLLRPVLRAFAGTAAYSACLLDARQKLPPSA